MILIQPIELYLTFSSRALRKITEELKEDFTLQMDFRPLISSVTAFSGTLRLFLTFFEPTLGLFRPF